MNLSTPQTSNAWNFCCNSWRKLTINGRITIVLIFYSIALNIVAGLLDLGINANFDGYWPSLNWSLYPLFWIVTGLGMFCSWQGFIAAWKDFFEQKMVTNGGDVLSDDDRERVLTRFVKWRRGCLAIVFVLAVICWWSDIQNEWRIYEYRNGAEKLSQLSAVSPVLSAIDNWLEDRPNIKKLISWNELHATPTINVHRTWMNAWFFTRNSQAGQRIGWRTNAVFLSLAYAQELVLIFYGFAITAQVWLHIFFFAALERMQIGNLKLELKLNHQSPIREFGLEQWNYALNNVYWLTTPGLIAAILSKYIHPNPDDTGQLVLQWGVPIFVTVPLVFTIVVRQSRLPKVWLDVRNDDSRRERYLEQMLWPFDRNWASKLGILMAFATLSYLVGVALTKFLP